MLIVLKPVLKLTGSEAEEFEKAVAEQRDFTVSDWFRRDMPHTHVFAVYLSDRFVGMCCWSGLPDRAQPWVWVVPRERCKGFGSAIIDRLANEMKSVGVTSVTSMPIETDGREANAAMRLATRLRANFHPAPRRRADWQPSETMDR